MRNLVLFIFLSNLLISLLPLKLKGQIITWAEVAGNNSVERVNDVISGPDGSFYMLASYQGTMTMGNFNLPAGAGSSRSSLIAKFSPSGALSWVKTINGGSNSGSAIAVDHNHNVYITGTTTGFSISVGTLTIPGNQNGFEDIYIAKFNQNGVLQWASIEGGVNRERAYDLEVDPSGNVYLIGAFQYSTTLGNYNLINPTTSLYLDGMIVKYAPSGNVLWASQLDSANLKTLINIKFDQAGNLYLMGRLDGNLSSSLTIQGTTLTAKHREELFWLKLDPAGNLLWAKQSGGNGTEVNIFMLVEENGDFYITGDFKDTSAISSQTLISQVPSRTDIFIAHFLSSGDIEWVIQGHGENYENVNANAIDDNGDLFVAGIVYDTMIFDTGDTLINPPNATTTSFLAKINKEGEVSWAKPNALNYAAIKHMATGFYGNLAIGGEFRNTWNIGNYTFTSNSWQKDIFLLGAFDTTFTSPPSNLVTGRIYNDENNNCTFDSIENSLSGGIVKAEPGPFYGISDSLGEYKILVDSGAYQISQIIPSLPLGQLMTPICPAYPTPHQVNFISPNSTSAGNDFANELVQCPYLEVNVSSSIFRRCFQGDIYIDYANRGNGTADSVKVVVNFPKYIIPISADSTWYVDFEGNYVFDIGMLDPGQTGRITIRDSIQCGDTGILGMTQCVKTWITPVNFCPPPDTSWSGADLLARGFCFGNDTIDFRIYNQGNDTMTDSVAFRLFRDQTLFYQGKIKLSAGDSLRLFVKSNGQTIRLECDQVNFHPKNQWIATTIEACGYDQGYVVSKGFVSQFPAYDYNQADLDIRCLPIQGSYDPNNKLADPIGYLDQKFVRADNHLFFQVNFQNTGNDTAFFVSVVDTLSSYLDISTLQIKGASHDYTFDLYGEGNPVLKFDFYDIILPDSQTNEPDSKGFINFSIAPYDSLANGTQIKNFADIFFDFNPPIRTDTTSHIISDSVLMNLSDSLVEICGILDSYLPLDTILCEQDSFYLKVAQPELGKGMWSLVNGSGNIIDSLNFETPVVGLPYGISTFKWELKSCDLASQYTAQILHASNPVPPVINGADAFCEGDSISLSIPQDFLKYHWSTGDTLPMIWIANSGEYFASIVDSNNCESPFSDTIVVSEISLLGKPEISLNSSGELESSIWGTAYSWYLNGIDLSMNDSVIAPYQSGNYTVQVYNQFCPSPFSEPFNYIATNAENLNTREVIKVYPNPFQETLIIQSEKMKLAGSEIKVWNRIGQLSLKTRIPEGFSDNRFLLSTSFLPEGLYLVQIGDVYMERLFHRK